MRRNDSNDGNDGQSVAGKTASDNGHVIYSFFIIYKNIYILYPFKKIGKIRWRMYLSVFSQKIIIANRVDLNNYERLYKIK